MKLFSVSFCFICVFILNIGINASLKNCQENENGKLYWIREFDKTKKEGFELGLDQTKRNVTEDFMSSTETFKISKQVENLNQQVDEMQKTCNCSQMWNHLNILQAQIRHLAVAMVSVQVCKFFHFLLSRGLKSTVSRC